MSLLICVSISIGNPPKGCATFIAEPPTHSPDTQLGEICFCCFFKDNTFTDNTLCEWTL